MTTPDALRDAQANVREMLAVARPDQIRRLLADIGRAESARTAGETA